MRDATVATQHAETSRERDDMAGTERRTRVAAEALARYQRRIRADEQFQDASRTSRAILHPAVRAGHAGSADAVRLTHR